MKKLLYVLIFTLLTTVSVSFADTSFSVVLDRMYTNGLTKFSTETSFRSNDSVTRGEISKFFVAYAKLENMLMINALHPSFDDIEGYDQSLIPYIDEAHAYGLMRGSETSDDRLLFRPKESLTEAEAITVIARTLWGMQDESAQPRWSHYYDLAYEHGIVSNTDVWSLDKKATRATVGDRLYKASFLEEIQKQDTQKLSLIQSSPSSVEIVSCTDANYHPIGVDDEGCSHPTYHDVLKNGVLSFSFARGKIVENDISVRFKKENNHYMCGQGTRVMNEFLLYENINGTYATPTDLIKQFPNCMIYPKRDPEQEYLSLGTTVGSQISCSYALGVTNDMSSEYMVLSILPLKNYYLISGNDPGDVGCFTDIKME